MIPSRGASLTLQGSGAVSLTMQDLSRTASQAHSQGREPDDPAEPLESRWQIALQNLDLAEDRCQKLERVLEGALYLDATEWQSAVPASKQQHAHMVGAPSFLRSVGMFGSVTRRCGLWGRKKGGRVPALPWTPCWHTLALLRSPPARLAVIHASHRRSPRPAQALQTRIQALERMLAEARAAQAASEAAKREAQSRVQELEGIVESNARIFELHHDALLEKTQTIQELETVISALSMGAGEGGGRG